MSKASYLANNGASKTFLYIVPFDGRTIGTVEKKIEMSRKNSFRAWNWDMNRNYSNYFTYIRNGRNTINFTRSFNGYSFGSVE